MRRNLILLLILAAGAPAAAEPVRASLNPPPPAQPLFERDWVLMNWALQHYDADRDILLEPGEAASAAAAFRKLADTNGDGRVTPEEYSAARKAILAGE